MCFGSSKEPSLRDGYFEYPQGMFWLRNKKKMFSYALLSGGLRTSMTHLRRLELSSWSLKFILYTMDGWNYPWVELIFMVLSLFEPLKFSCNFIIQPNLFYFWKTCFGCLKEPFHWFY